MEDSERGGRQLWMRRGSGCGSKQALEAAASSGGGGKQALEAILSSGSGSKL